MDTSALKRYAPAARDAFIAAVTSQAARIGIRRSEVLPATVEGDVLLVGGEAFPRAWHEPRNRLIARIEAAGFEGVMEAAAYTWFNRLAAIRYMEVNGYLSHSYRVLSHPGGGLRPELLEHATEVSLPGLDRDRVVELKLDGTKDEELYRLLLKAQCNALHEAMPFLFERIGDETELLLPANLLNTDSLIRQMVDEVEEEQWRDIEIVGWLYQFYISDKKDEVMGGKVKPEDIPAATQLFTPNWIVKYLVQNSIGAQWLATYPESGIREQMEYYIEPAEQEPEVQAELDAITRESLNPEELTVIDPASGSGHILVEAYALLKAIYLERGYRERDIPKLILEKNLFGLDIDPRAEQLTGFALMMKARADDRRLFERDIRLNVMALRDSDGFDPSTIAQCVSLKDYGLGDKDLLELKQLFEHATTFGSLIQVPEELAGKLPAMAELAEAETQDLFVRQAFTELWTLVRQARVLAEEYDAVIANPPYMGSRGMDSGLKRFVKEAFPEGKADLFACFILQGFRFAADHGFNAMITMQSWMFLKSYSDLRRQLLSEKMLCSALHLGPRAFSSISGEVVQTVAAVHRSASGSSTRPAFVDLTEGGEGQKETRLRAGVTPIETFSQSDLADLPGAVLSYWIPKALWMVFTTEPALSTIAEARQGLITGDNDRFIRKWWEVDEFRCSLIGGNSRQVKWFGHNKGGGYRRWYGNMDDVVDWADDGYEIRNLTGPDGRQLSRPQSIDFYFREALTWSRISSSLFGVRFSPEGRVFDSAGPSIFPEDVDPASLLPFLCSSVTPYILGALNPTLTFQVGDILQIPIRDLPVSPGADAILAAYRSDWNAFENSAEFERNPLVLGDETTLREDFGRHRTESDAKASETYRAEVENNLIFIGAYGLQGELSPEVPIEEITLTCNPAYRYGPKLSEEARWTRFREDTMKELVSYAVGCMMGRYSLDEPGLIYAHSGNVDFDSSKYSTFPADDDGIIPITDMRWFDDDAAQRLIEFIAVAWDAEHLEENLDFLAENLSPRKSESSRDTIRRYFTDSFFKDHVQTYQKRPIYWLFTSGKQKALQALVYLHRYNEGTLARMRSEYVIPLEGKIAHRIEQLAADIDAATSSSQKKRLEKERDTLEKQQVELRDFDERLRHFADQRITLDLDDGVKVNYGQFGDLLDSVKKIHGKNPKAS